MGIAVDPNQAFHDMQVSDLEQYQVIEPFEQEILIRKHLKSEHGRDVRRLEGIRKVVALADELTQVFQWQYDINRAIDSIALRAFDRE